MQRECINEQEAKNELNTKDSIKIETGLDIVVSKCNIVIDGSKPKDIVIKNTINFIEKINKRVG